MGGSHWAEQRQELEVGDGTCGAGWHHQQRVGDRRDEWPDGLRTAASVGYRSACGAPVGFACIWYRSLVLTPALNLGRVLMADAGLDDFDPSFNFSCPSGTTFRPIA